MIMLTRPELNKEIQALYAAPTQEDLWKKFGAIQLQLLFYIATHLETLAVTTEAMADYIPSVLEKKVRKPTPPATPEGE